MQAVLFVIILIGVVIGNAYLFQELKTRLDRAIQWLSIRGQLFKFIAFIVLFDIFWSVALAVMFLKLVIR